MLALYARHLRKFEGSSPSKGISVGGGFFFFFFSPKGSNFVINSTLQKRVRQERGELC